MCSDVLDDDDDEAEDATEEWCEEDADDAVISGDGQPYGEQLLCSAYLHEGGASRAAHEAISAVTSGRQTGSSSKQRPTQDVSGLPRRPVTPSGPMLPSNQSTRTPDRAIIPVSLRGTTPDTERSQCEPAIAPAPGDVVETDLQRQRARVVNLPPNHAHEYVDIFQTRSKLVRTPQLGTKRL